MSTLDPLAQFLAAVSDSLRDSGFIKLVLGHYTGADPTLKQVHARPILVKKQPKLSVTYRHKTRDIVKNYLFAESIVLLEQLLGEFKLATLYTETQDMRYDASGKKPNLKSSKPSQQKAELSHDRQKQRPVQAARPFLQALNITDANGQVFKNAQDKYRQINKYIEIIAGLVEKTPVARVADMGAGKGYLTFALYDYLTNTLKRDVDVTGVEYRADMVALCNEVAAECGFDKLRFVQGSIADFDSSGTDLLIALHACDTATDDAIAKGIAAKAKLIVVAPCCHKQIRQEIEKAQQKTDLDFVTRHGTFLERQAEMVTDGLRALMLEYHGYSTKLFEFVSDAHTPKNVMIVGTRNKAAGSAEAKKKIEAAKDYFGIRQHYLEILLPR